MTTFTIPGPEYGQKRPRARRVGERAGVYDDPANKPYADRVVYAWRQAGGASLGSGPLSVFIDVYHARPNDHYLKSGALNTKGLCESWCVRMPDLDNVAKAITDALNGLAYDDDRQIITLLVRRHWADADVGPRVAVLIKPPLG